MTRRSHHSTLIIMLLVGSLLAGSCAAVKNNSSAGRKLAEMPGTARSRGQVSRPARLGEKRRAAQKLESPTTPETTQAKQDNPQAKPQDSTVKPSQKASEIIAYAKKYAGTRYKYGGNTPAGFDCSGYLEFVFGHYSVFLPRTTSEQYGQSKRITIDEIRPGDLAFFNGRSIGSTVGHVALITEVSPSRKGTFKMIHATVSGGVMIDSYPDGGYYSSRLIGFGRVLDY
ncbi:MAG: C40 family peptidase [Bacteroidales bacterium]|nr:C40 family peptidase [Bacteroidales bacterium]